MKCANENTLRAWIDGQLPSFERDKSEEHISACGTCGAKVAEMRKRAAEVELWMSSLESEPAEEVDPERAYAAFLIAHETREAGVLARARKWLSTPQLTMAACVVALVAVLSLSPAQSWAQRFLQVLRVQKLAVVPVDTSALVQAGPQEVRHRALTQLVSDSVVVTLKPGSPTVVADAGAAAAMVGFPVETLDGIGTPDTVEVEDQGAFHMKLNADRIRAVFEEVGRSDIQVPASVDGSEVAVQVSKGVKMRYGKDDAGAIVFLQVPTPNVSMPPELNMQALAEAGLQLSGMSATAAHEFANTVDWASTLVVPIPADRTVHRTVPVDGVEGVLVEWPPTSSYRGSYNLLWLKNGVVHVVSGHGSSAAALAAVSDLH
jgi:anti-sigma factor RsiW